MAEQVAQQFTEFYYKTFDSNRAGLAGLYRDHSMMTWESSPFMGSKAIVEKLSALPFQRIQHIVKTTDAQPSDEAGTSIVVLVTGELLFDEETNPMKFSQTFQLRPEGGSYYVFNDLFRLNYG